MLVLLSARPCDCLGGSSGHPAPSFPTLIRGVLLACPCPVFSSFRGRWLFYLGPAREGLSAREKAANFVEIKFLTPAFYSC